MPLLATAAEVAEKLGLTPHPEGGYFRETFRDEDGPDGRSRSTAILYLLPAGGRSCLHKVDAAELWHFHAGNPVTLIQLTEDGRAFETTLSDELDNPASTPQHVMPKGVWFGAFATGAEGYSLCSCTVAPGFVWEGFEMGKRSELLASHGEDAREWILRLTNEDVEQA